MKVAALPVNERERLKTLNDYYILETLPDSVFDDVAKVAAGICNNDCTVCCLADVVRQWVMVKDPLISAELVHDLLFFDNATNDGVYIIPDTLDNERLATSVHVVGQPNIRFCARVPLCGADGKSIGCICLFSTQPCNLSKHQIEALQALTNQVYCQLELRKKINDLKQTQAEQKSAYADLEKFSFVASHDLRSPLNNIISLTTLLKEDFANQLDEEGKEYIDFLNNAANQLADLVTGILEYSRSSQMLVDNKENFNLPELIKEVINLLNAPGNIKITYSENDCIINTSRIAMKQILLNLCDNAIKHNDKDKGTIDITIDDGKYFYTFEVADNGPGIEQADQRRIFELFERVKRKSKENDGIGVGLSIVKRLVEKLGGSIKVISEVGMGTAFVFTIEK